MPARMHKPAPAKPRLRRVALLKAVLQSFRGRLDEELAPLGITTAQLRLMWMVAENPDASGAEVARLCSVTPQTGQAIMARLQANGWVRRTASKDSERVLVAELTSSGRKVLGKAREISERLESRMWETTSERSLAALERALVGALASLEAEGN